MAPLTRILVPVDFSPASRAAVLYAADIAERFGSTVHVLHVWEPPRVVAPELLLLSRGDYVLTEFSGTDESAEMQALLALLEHRFVRATGRLDSGDPVHTILKVARAEAFDLIIMGTHGRTGLAHLLIGSVAERVMRRAPCPVLTIHREDAALVEPMAEASP